MGKYKIGNIVATSWLYQCRYCGFKYHNKCVVPWGKVSLKSTSNKRFEWKETSKALIKTNLGKRAANMNPFRWESINTLKNDITIKELLYLQEHITIN
jgi:hypothetical protein